MVHDCNLLLYPATQENKVGDSWEKQSDDIDSIAVEDDAELQEVESLPRHIETDTQKFEEEAVSLAKVVKAAISINKKPQCKIQFVRKVQSCKGTITNEAFEDAFDIEICAEN